MPYLIRKIRNKSCYAVKNIETGHLHSKCTSLEKAKKQKRLLEAIDHGWKPKSSPVVRKSPVRKSPVRK